jgi:hypothetical protein
MIEVLKHDTVDLLVTAIDSGQYEFISEARTFE